MFTQLTKTYTTETSCNQLLLIHSFCYVYTCSSRSIRYLPCRLVDYTYCGQELRAVRYATRCCCSPSVQHVVRCAPPVLCCSPRRAMLTSCQENTVLPIVEVAQNVACLRPYSIHIPLPLEGQQILSSQREQVSFSLQRTWHSRPLWMTLANEGQADVKIRSIRVERKRSLCKNSLAGVKI